VDPEECLDDTEDDGGEARPQQDRKQQQSIEFAAEQPFPVMREHLQEEHQVRTEVRVGCRQRQVDERER
jgi:hypothetical protein